MFDGHGFGFGGGFMWLFWVVLIAVIVWVLRTTVGGKQGGQGTAKTPLEILQERFAHGEIDEAEYKRKRKLLDA